MPVMDSGLDSRRNRPHKRTIAFSTDGWLRGRQSSLVVRDSLTQAARHLRYMCTTWSLEVIDSSHHSAPLSLSSPHRAGRATFVRVLPRAMSVPTCTLSQTPGPGFICRQHASHRRFHAHTRCWAKEPRHGAPYDCCTREISTLNKQPKQPVKYIHGIHAWTP
jgi:hypothetical protein